MKAPETIHTARLLLRKSTAGDAEAIFRRYAGDPQATRFMSWPTHTCVADTEAFLSWSDREWERWPAGPYLVLARDGQNQTLLGGTGLAFAAPALAATGYILARDAWGRGFATEALKAMVEIARQTGVLRLEAICHTNHSASARVLEKCGFKQEGRLAAHTEFPNLAPGIRCDVLSYAVTP